MLLNNQLVKEEITRETRKSFEIMKTKPYIKPYRVKAVLKGKFITITTDTKQEERSEIIKIRVKTNKIENKKIIEKMNKAKSWISVNIKKIDKPLVTMTKGEKKRERTEFTKIRNEKGTTLPTL